MVSAETSKTETTLAFERVMQHRAEQLAELEAQNQAFVLAAIRRRAEYSGTSGPMWHVLAENALTLGDQLTDEQALILANVAMGETTAVAELYKQPEEVRTLAHLLSRGLIYLCLEETYLGYILVPYELTDELIAKTDIPF